MNYLSKFSAALQLPYGWWKKLVLFGLAVFFINVGVDHFINPDFYLSIMPPAFPMHAEAVYVSGFFEILGGICVLIPRLRIIAGWGTCGSFGCCIPSKYLHGAYTRSISRYPGCNTLLSSPVTVPFLLLGLLRNSSSL